MSDRPSGAAPPRLVAVLGPTNTGKTHLAVERMLGHASGMIGLPLRLLAREIYDRIVKLRGEDPQSWRDLAVTLSEWGKATRSRARLEEAMNLFVKVAFTPWQRHADTISIFALEELNALINVDFHRDRNGSDTENSATVSFDKHERFSCLIVRKGKK